MDCKDWIARGFGLQKHTRKKLLEPSRAAFVNHASRLQQPFWNDSHHVETPVLQVKKNKKGRPRLGRIINTAARPAVRPPLISRTACCCFLYTCQAGVARAFPSSFNILQPSPPYTTVYSNTTLFFSCYHFSNPSSFFPQGCGKFLYCIYIQEIIRDTYR
jgi:hypothetical protein